MLVVVVVVVVGCACWWSCDEDDDDDEAACFWEKLDTDDRLPDGCISVNVIVFGDDELASIEDPSSPGLVSGTSTLVGCGGYGSTDGLQKLFVLEAPPFSTEDGRTSL